MKRRKHILLIIFTLYIVVLLYLLFLSDERSVMETYRYNLEPFKEIERFIKYRKVLGLRAFGINIVGNIVAFVPFGILLPAINEYRRFKGFAYTLLLSFLFTLMIETVQLLTKVGRFDIDDIILNTLGGVIGYIIYLILTLLRKGKGHAVKKR